MNNAKSALRHCVSRGLGALLRFALIPPTRKTTITIPWVDGLHLRPAAGLVVNLAKSFQFQLTLRLGSAATDATSIMSVMVFCAGLNSILEVEASGSDEVEALAAIEEFFELSPS